MPLSGNTLVVCVSVSLDQDTLTESKHILDRVISTATKIYDDSDIPEKVLLNRAGISQMDYLHALQHTQNKSSIVYQKKPSKVDIGLYNLVILKLFEGRFATNYANKITEDADPENIISYTLPAHCSNIKIIEM